MSDEATSKSGKVWLYVVALVLALPLCYVLSVGPVTVLGMRDLYSESAFKSLYTPLQSFAQATNTEDLIRSYIQVWMSATGTDWPPPK